jgi:hypothetical protein
MTDIKITKLEWRPLRGMRYTDPARNTLLEVGALVVTWEVPYDHALALHCERLQFESYGGAEAMRVRPVFSGFVPVLEGEWEIWPPGHRPPGHPAKPLVEMLSVLHDTLLARLDAVLMLPEAVPDDA